MKIRVLYLILAALILAGVQSSPSVAQAQTAPEFKTGFKTLADQIPQVAGLPLENERAQDDGTIVQQTTGGLMVWNPAGNMVRFTDGYQSWVLADGGVLERLNSLRYPWEVDPKGLATMSSMVDLRQGFQDAVRNAAVADPAEIASDLVAITEDDEKLIWRGEPGNRRLLVSTWTSWPGYNGKEGTSTTAGVDTWVTVSPQVKEFCLRGDYPDPTLRLEQLLGLPSDNGKRWFVELWVSPSDLFRPAADSDIATRTAGLDYPPNVSDAHVAWIENLKAQSYGDNGYPWTRLGYTYDWGNPKSEEGLSEFVIRKGSPIEVSSVSTTLNYCN